MFGELKELHLELTNRCNLKCPLCLRTRLPELVKDPNDIDYDILLKILKSEKCKNLINISMVGNLGEPILYPKFLDLCKEIRSIHKNCRIYISTNASLKDEEFWYELGKIPRVEVAFAIDGLEDTNEVYRVGSNWDKIIRNVKSYINSGGHAKWVFIPFDHNEHQVDDAKELSKKLGFKEFQITYTNRPKSKLKNKNLQADYINEGLKFYETKCHAEERNYMYITARNEVWPCCWLSGRKETNYDDFFSLIDFEINIKKDNFENILNNYNKIEDKIRLYWDLRKSLTCSRHCGSNEKSEYEKIKL